MPSSPSTFRRLFLWIRDSFDVLRRCWLVIIMLGIAWYALIVNDQGRDVLTGFNDYPSSGVHHPFSKYLLVCILLFGWCFYTWFSSGIALHLSDFPLQLGKDPHHGKRIRFLQKWIPRMLGVAAYGVIFIAYLKYVHFYFLDILFLLPLLLYLLYVIRQRYILSKIAFLKRYKLASPNTITQKGLRPGELSRLSKLTFALLLLIFLTVVIVIILFPEKLLINDSPLIIILLALSLWTGLITFLIAVEKGYRFPAIFTVLLAAYFFSYLNNNHTVRTIAVDSIRFRPDVRTHFRDWLLHDHKKKDPVILISGEGGGIRAGYWTAGFLAKLHDELPETDSCIYALSTVSGSSLGAAAYTALRVVTGTKSNENFSSPTDSFFHFNFLSPVTAGFLFPDLIQRDLPFPVPPWDRARYLEYSWEYSWRQVSGESRKDNLMGKPLTAIWRHAAIPLVFFNSTKAENGDRAVAAYATLPEVKNDLLQIMQKDIPLSTAALLSARFPFITPGAVIKNEDGEKWGTIVDGGYYDNSGTVTLQDIYNEIRPVLDSAAADFNKSIILLVIQNGNHEDDTTTVLHQAYEVKTVLNAFYNAWAARPDKQVEEFSNAALNNRDTLMKVSLVRNSHINLPLGWYLSDSARARIHQQLQGRPVRDILSALKTRLQ